MDKKRMNPRRQPLAARVFSMVLAFAMLFTSSGFQTLAEETGGGIFGIVQGGDDGAQAQEKHLDTKVVREILADGEGLYLRYTVTVENGSAQAAEDVTVKAVLGAGLEWDEARTASQGTAEGCRYLTTADAGWDETVQEELKRAGRDAGASGSAVVWDIASIPGTESSGEPEQKCTFCVRLPEGIYRDHAEDIPEVAFFVDSKEVKKDSIKDWTGKELLAEAPKETEAQTESGTSAPEETKASETETQAQTEPEAQTESETSAPEETKASETETQAQTETEAQAESVTSAPEETKASETETEAQTESGTSAPEETKASETETQAQTETEAQTESGTSAPEETKASETETQTQTESETSAPEETKASETETQAQTETEFQSEAVTETQTATETQTESETSTPEETKASETETEAQTETETQTESETSAPEETKASETETEAQTESETSAPEETKASETETEAQTETELQTEAVTETQTETEAQTETELQSETATETQTEAETQMETELQTEAVTETQTETEAQTETLTETEAQTESETSAPEETKASETEVQSETETELQTETETDILIEDETSETELQTETEETEFPLFEEASLKEAEPMLMSLAEEAEDGTLQAQINKTLEDETTGGNITLTLHTDYTENLVIPDDTTVTIDLNSYTLSPDENARPGTGTLNTITVYGTLLVQGGDGMIANTGVPNARGVAVASGGYFRMDSGTITGFHVDNGGNGNGGGVMVENHGTFHMEGGAIRGNTAAGYGGGVFAYDVYTREDGSRTLALKAGEVSGNMAANGGGVAVYQLSGGTYAVSTPVQITGNNAANNGGGIYLDSPAAEFTVSSGSVQNNAAGYDGGGIYLAGKAEQFTIAEGAEISGNRAGHYGGGVYLAAGTKLTMTGGLVSGNCLTGSGVSNHHGGGVYLVNTGSFVMTGGTVSGNCTEDTGTISEMYGGGVYVGSNSNVELSGGTIEGNKYFTRGGGIYIGDGTPVQLTDGMTIRDNCLRAVTSGYGAGLYMGNKTLTMTGGLVTGNYSEGENEIYGGGIYISGTLDMQGGKVRENHVCGNGGGIQGGTVRMSGGLVTENIADDSAGGICATTYLSGSAVVSYNECKGNGGGVNGKLEISGDAQIVHNTAAGWGGGQYGSPLVMTGGTVAYNTSAGWGGGLSGVNVNSVAELSGGTIAHNTANDGGGVVWYSNGGSSANIIISGTVDIFDNTAKNTGGGVYVRGDLTMDGGTIHGNTAVTGGGLYRDGYFGTGRMLGGMLYDNTASAAKGGHDYYQAASAYKEEEKWIAYELGLPANFTHPEYGNATAWFEEKTSERLDASAFEGTQESGTPGGGAGDPGEPESAAGVTVKDGVRRETLENNGAQARAYTLVYDTRVNPAAQIDEDHTYPSVQAAVDALKNQTAEDPLEGTTITLLRDSTENVEISAASGTGDPGDGTGASPAQDPLELTLDLAGHTLRGLNSSVVFVDEGVSLTITDSSASGGSAGTGTITGGSGRLNDNRKNNTQSHGGGLYVLGSVTLESGGVTGNAADIGAGVYVGQQGSFTLKEGGRVDGNRGYGVCVNYSEDNGKPEGAVFTMLGGSVSRNTSAGILMRDQTSVLYIRDGVIEENGARGVYMESSGKIEMSGGAVRNNKVTNGSGGGFYLSGGTFTFTGGTISGNEASSYGGGVYAGTTTIVMGNVPEEGGATVKQPSPGGIITGNRANNGGGLYFNSGNVSLNVYAGRICGNSANVRGKDLGIEKNTYATWKVMHLLAAENMGVEEFDSWYDEETEEYYTEPLTDRSVRTLYLAATKNPEEERAVRLGSGSTVEYYTSIAKAVARIREIEAGGGAEPAPEDRTIYLCRDHSESVTVNEGDEIKIDLNGRTLSTDRNQIFYINGGKLSVTDSSRTGDTRDADAGNGGGTLTPAEGNLQARAVYMNSGELETDHVVITGFGDPTYPPVSGTPQRNGGAIFAQSNCTVRLGTGTVLSDNHAYLGGAVCMMSSANDARFEFYMEGAVVKGNVAQTGGGLYLQPSHTSKAATDQAIQSVIEIGNSEISGNTSKGSGGGLYVYGHVSTVNGDVVTVPGRVHVLLDGVQITDNRAESECGGAYIYRAQTIKILNSTISGNRSRGSYAGIRCNPEWKSAEDTIKVRGTTISGNVTETGSYAGGAFSGNNTVNGCHIQDNRAEKYQAYDSGLALTGGRSTLTDTEISGNYAYYGGALVVGGKYFEMGDGVKIHDNTAKGWGNVYLTTTTECYLNGGEVCDNTGVAVTTVNAGNMKLVLHGIQIHDNYSTGLQLDYDAVQKDPKTAGVTIMEGTVIENNLGSGVRVSTSQPFWLTMEGGIIRNNQVSGDGGGIYKDRGGFLMTGGEIYGNTATGSGGGILIRKTCWDSSNAPANDLLEEFTDTISGGEIRENTAANGGGVYVTSYLTDLKISGGEIRDNTATSYGGGVYMADYKSTLRLAGGKVYDNKARLGQDVYAAYNYKNKNTAMHLTKAADMFGGGDFRAGIGWLDEERDNVLKNQIAYDPVLRRYALTLQYETADIVALVQKADGSWQEFTSVQAAVNAVEEDAKTAEAKLYKENPQILLVKDAVGNVRFPGGVAATLNLNGYTLQGNTTALTVYGDLTVADEPIEGRIEIGDPAGENVRIYVAKKDAEDNPATGTITGSAPLYGGGVLVRSGGSVKMTGGQITDCYAAGAVSGSTYGGAGVCVEGGKFELADGSINNNNSTYGAAVYVRSGAGEFSMTGGRIENNTAGDGGVIWVNGGVFRMTGGEISGNKGKNYAGALYLASGKAYLEGGVIENNLAANRGGAIYQAAGTMRIGGVVKITGNYTTNARTTDVTTGAGGAVYMDNGTLYISGGAQISGNRASGRGGAVYQVNGTIRMTGGTITENTADLGGGIAEHPTARGVFLMTGGGLYNNTSVVTSAGNDFYSRYEGTAKYPSNDNFPRATLMEAVRMEQEGYNSWKDDTYDGSVRTAEEILKGQYVTGRINESYGLQLTAADYGETDDSGITSTMYVSSINWNKKANVGNGTGVVDGTGAWDTEAKDSEIYTDGGAAVEGTGQDAWMAADTTEETDPEDPTAPPTTVVTEKYAGGKNGTMQAKDWSRGDDSSNCNGIIRTYDKLTYDITTTIQDSRSMIVPGTENGGNTENGGTQESGGSGGTQENGDGNGGSGSSGSGNSGAPVIDENGGSGNNGAPVIDGDGGDSDGTGANGEEENSGNGPEESGGLSGSSRDGGTDPGVPEEEEKKKIRLYMEIELPASEDEAEFDSTVTRDMQSYEFSEYQFMRGDKQMYGQKLTGYRELDVISGQSATVDSNVVINVKAMKNAETLQPVFRQWIGGNSDETYNSKKELKSPVITVSALGMYNLTLQRNKDLSYTGYFDLENGEEVSRSDWQRAKEEAEQAGKESSIVYGTMLGYGLTLSLRSDKKTSDLRGIQLPGGDINFDLRLRGSLYLDGEQVKDSEGNPVVQAPYIWAYKENIDTSTGTDISNLNHAVNMDWNDEDDVTRSTRYAYDAAPFNTGANNYSCYSGGVWNASGAQPAPSDTETNMHFTVSNYTVEPSASAAPNASSDNSTLAYFNGNTVKPFSAGYLQVIFPIDTDKVQGESGYLQIGMEGIVSDLDIRDSGGELAPGRDIMDADDEDLDPMRQFFGTDGVYGGESGADNYTNHAVHEMLYLDNYLNTLTGLYVYFGNGTGNGNNLTKTNFFNNASNGGLSGDRGTASTPVNSQVWIGANVIFGSEVIYTTENSAGYDWTTGRLRYINPDDFDEQKDNYTEYNYMTAMNLLQKFDADAYTPVGGAALIKAHPADVSKSGIVSVSTTETATDWDKNAKISKDYELTVLYAAKPDGSNWEKAENWKSVETEDLSTPNRGGELDMDKYEEENLIYFETLEALYERFGYDENGQPKGKCVAILYQFRNCFLRTGRSYTVTAKMKVTDDFEKTGMTYCTTNDVRCWTTYRPFYKATLDIEGGTLTEKPATYMEDGQEITYMHDDLLYQFLWNNVQHGGGGFGLGLDPDTRMSQDQIEQINYDDHEGKKYQNRVSVGLYSRNYRKTEYDKGNPVSGTHTGWYDGNTLLLYTLDSSIDIGVADIIQGSTNTPKSSYSVSEGERTVKYRVTPNVAKISGQSYDIIENGKQSTEVTITLTVPKHLHFDKGSIGFEYAGSGYAETDLIWDTEVEEVLDAEGNQTGVTKIVLKTVVSDISKKLPKILFSCTIGARGCKAGDAWDEDVRSGETLTTKAEITTTYSESNHIATNSKTDTTTIHVVRTTTDSIWIEGGSLNELGEDLKYTLNYSNASADTASIEIGDIFPYNGDGRGTSFTGAYRVHKIRLRFEKEEDYLSFLGQDGGTGGAGAADLVPGKLKLVRSVAVPGREPKKLQEAIKTLGQAASDVTLDLKDVGASGNEWVIEYTPSEELIQRSDEAAGIALYGSFPRVRERGKLKIDLVFTPRDPEAQNMTLLPGGGNSVQKGGNLYGDNFFYSSSGNEGLLSTTEIIRVIERAISGLAWMDQDQDGWYSTLNGSTDRVLQNIDVYLYTTVDPSTLDTSNGTKDDHSDDFVKVEKIDENGVTVWRQTVNGQVTTRTAMTVDGTTYYPAVDILGNLVKPVATPNTGKYSFGQLAKGTYYVFFDDASANYNVVNDATRLKFDRLSVTQIPEGAPLGQRVNRARSDYAGQTDSTENGAAPLAKAFISNDGNGIPLPAKEAIVGSSSYLSPNWNCGLYYIDLSLEKTWENIQGTSEQIDSGTEVTFHVTAQTDGGVLYTSDYTMKANQDVPVRDPASNSVDLTPSDRLIDTESNITLLPATATVQGNATDHTVTWKLEHRALQAEGAGGRITYTAAEASAKDPKGNKLSGYRMLTENKQKSPTEITWKFRALNQRIRFAVDLTKISASVGAGQGAEPGEDVRQKLAGAEFRLFRKNGDGTETEVAKASTKADGTLSFPNLEAGTYYLEETKAPSGYERSKAQYRIEIRYASDGAANPEWWECVKPDFAVYQCSDKDGNPLSQEQLLARNAEVKVTPDVGTYSVYASDGAVKAEEINADTEIGDIPTYYHIYLCFDNTCIYELPETGGIGILWSTLAGVALMLAALLLADRRRRLSAR